MISATKYRAIEKKKGVLCAIFAIANDIGSQKGLVVGNRRDGAFFAHLDDVSVILQHSRSGGTLSGIGDEPDTAIAALFENLLKPENCVPSGYDKTEARLAVGDFHDPKAIIKVEKEEKTNRWLGWLGFAPTY